jgi:KaiC/GvpD/RAD55 family RecA-like ATPase
MVRFLKTGIDNLDMLLGGGLAEASTMLLIGPAGTLKSHIAQQFIFKGLEDGENCLYVSTLEDLNGFQEQLKLGFGWDVKPFVEKGLLKFVDLSRFWPLEPSQLRTPVDVDSVSEAVFKAMREVGEKGGGRMCFSTLSHLFNLIMDIQAVERFIFGLRKNARENNLTSLLIMDEGAQEKIVEETIKSICDYVLTTYVRDSERMIRISKAPVKHGLESFRLLFKGKKIEIEVIL